MKIANAVALVSVFGLGLVAGTTLDAAAPPPEANVKTVLVEPLAHEFTPDREVRIDLVHFVPGATLEWHWHPGEEFHYYLEGEVDIRIEGLPTIHGRPGTAGRVPYAKKHVAIAGKDGARVLVFRVHTTGEPWRHVAHEKHPD